MGWGVSQSAGQLSGFCKWPGDTGLLPLEYCCVGINQPAKLPILSLIEVIPCSQLPLSSVSVCTHLIFHATKSIAKGWGISSWFRSPHALPKIPTCVSIHWVCPQHTSNFSLVQNILANLMENDLLPLTKIKELCSRNKRTLKKRTAIRRESFSPL